MRTFIAQLAMLVPISYLLFATFSDVVAIGLLLVFAVGLGALAND